MAANDVFDFHESDSESEFGGFQPGDVPDTAGLDSGSDIDVSDIDDDEEERGNLFDLDDEDFQAPDWTTGTFERVFVPGFSSATGPQFPDNFDAENATPWEYAKLFLTKEVLTLILNNTNKYARWQQQKTGRPNPMWKEDLTMPELKAFLAINIVMGLNPTPQYACYWSQSCFMGNEGVKKLMSKNRYEVISQYLHVSDREKEIPKGENGYDRAAKIRPLMNLLGPLFRRLNLPSRDQTIDEGMQKYDGRSFLKQYMADKPCKRGLKFYLRNDSETGYLQEFELYLGKRGPVDTKSGFGIFFDVVDRLTSKIQFKNHRVFVDNLYTSVPIMQHLQRNGIYCCGTLRSNRKNIPPEIKQKRTKEKRGWHITYQDRNNHYLTCSSWMDTKNVKFISSLSDPTVEEECTRRSGARSIVVKMPSCAFLYNLFMNGTDQFDQDRQYPVGRPAKKMWKYLLWFFVSACLVNAWILYQKSTKRKKTKKYGQLHFRLEIVDEMTREFSSRSRHNLRPDLAADHTNVKMGAKRARRCKVHRQHFGKPADTSRGCKACGQFLCYDCHAIIHAQ